MESPDIRLTDKEKKIKFCFALDYKRLMVNVQGIIFKRMTAKKTWLPLLGSPSGRAVTAGD